MRAHGKVLQWVGRDTWEEEAVSGSTVRKGRISLRGSTQAEPALGVQEGRVPQGCHSPGDGT